jgi:hypothetical protein
MRPNDEAKIDRNSLILAACRVVVRFPCYISIQRMVVWLFNITSKPLTSNSIRIGGIVFVLRNRIF